MTRRLLYFSPAIEGGLADYAREQANAIARLGVTVDFLSSPNFAVRDDDQFKLVPELPMQAPRSRFRFMNRLSSARSIVRHYNRLARAVERGNYRHVLLGSYAEYLAPCWAGRLQTLARDGTIFGAVVHDPVRDYVVGSKWWHRRSVAVAYSFLREAFVHEPIALDTVQPVPKMRTTVIPHGIYAFPSATNSGEEIRRKMGIPEHAWVWLSFGHVRDGKNLDLSIRALAQFPDAFLVVAGKEQSSGQRPVKFYQDLAEECGVTSRCLWLNRFIAPDEVGNLFAACDLVLLTYSKDFRSASGVLNTAAWFRKPCLASSGEGNLRTMISRYDLGIWIEPDRLEAMIDGLRRVRLSPPVPRWDAYAAANSWTSNAELVVDRMFDPARS